MKSISAISLALWFAIVSAAAPFERVWSGPAFDTDQKSPQSGGVPQAVLIVQEYIRLKQYDKASAALAELEKKDPKSSTLLNLKGTIAYQKRDRLNARANFEKAIEADSLSLNAASNLALMDLEDGNPQAARNRFQSILRAKKNSLDALMAIAKVAEVSKQPTEYEYWLKQAAQLNPGAIQPRGLLVKYLLDKQDAKGALVYAGQAQAANPDDRSALDLLGTAQMANGDAKSALSTYTRLVEVDAKDPAAHFKRATAQMALGDANGTIVSLTQALKLQPGFGDAKLLMALAKSQTGKVDEALALSRQYQKEYPRSVAGPTLEGDLLSSQKQFDKALARYEAAYALDPSASLVIKQYQALFASGKGAAGESRVLDWLKAHGDDVPTRIYLGSLYLRTGRRDAAIEQYQRAVFADGKNVRALNDLAYLYGQAKDKRALATAERAYQLLPHSPEVLDTLGWILVDQGDAKRATKYLEEAVSLAPESTLIRYHLAAALAKANDKAAARKLLEKLLADQKAFPERAEADALLKQL